MEKNPPFVVVGAPMVVDAKVVTLDPKSKEYELQMQRGIAHLDFCAELYEEQRRSGRLFLHEHPESAWSLDLPSLRRLATAPNVNQVTGDQYVNSEKSIGSVLRRTRWISNCEELTTVLKKSKFQQLPGQVNSKNCERFPPSLVLAILHALRLQRVQEGQLLAVEAGPTAEEVGLHIDFDSVRDETQKFYDEYTGLELPAEGVRRARREEMEFMATLGVWYVEARAVACADGTRPIGVRWIDNNKGDDAAVCLRSRLVVQETRRVSSIAPGDVQSTFAATPPIEALRFLLSLMMTLIPPPGEDWVLVIVDISRAHPHCDALRKIVINLPAEAGESEDKVGVLIKMLYGCRDAGQAFEFKVLKCMVELAHRQGYFPRVYISMPMRLHVYGCTAMISPPYCRDREQRHSPLGWDVFSSSRFERRSGSVLAMTIPSVF